MAEPRKDVKVYFDPEVHAALKAMSDAAGDIGLAALVESMVVPLVRAKVREVTVLAEAFRRSGISREGPESGGGGGK